LASFFLAYGGCSRPSTAYSPVPAGLQIWTGVISKAPQSSATPPRYPSILAFATRTILLVPPGENPSGPDSLSQRQTLLLVPAATELRAGFRRPRLSYRRPYLARFHRESGNNLAVAPRTQI